VPYFTRYTVFLSIKQCCSIINKLLKVEEIIRLAIILYFERKCFHLISDYIKRFENVRNVNLWIPNVVPPPQTETVSELSTFLCICVFAWGGKAETFLEFDGMDE